MTMHILVPLDGSTFSAAATSVALELARTLERPRVIGLHVVNVRGASGSLLRDIPGRLGFEPAIVDEGTLQAKEAIAQRLVQAFRTQAERMGVTVETRVEHGSVGEVLKAQADHVDLVVMGIRGESEDRHPGQGGALAFSTVPQIDAAVLLVPRLATAITAVALGYDGSPAAAHTLATLRRVVEGTKIQVHAIYVSADGQGGEVLSAVKEALPDNVVHTHVVKSASVREGLAKTMLSCDANLLAVGFTGKNKLRDMVMNTVAERQLLESDMMVLIAP